MRQALVAANWKMHGSRAQLANYLQDLQLRTDVEVVLLPPAVFLSMALESAPSGMMCGVQNISAEREGAFTGELAAEMVADLGGGWAIVGHSERRMQHQESDVTVAAKAAAALRGALQPIVCVGETLEQREAGQAQAIVGQQLAAVLDRVPCSELVNAAIGYEPVWAIGTGQTATPQQAQEMHAFIRAQLATADAQAAAKIRIVYGGSVKPGNAKELFAQEDIDGGLVGGASMNADDFSAIIAAASAAN